MKKMKKRTDGGQRKKKEKTKTVMDYYGCGR